uniref:Uncharacterized protein LOC111102568 n=1 Tax=Crassostrea virginica TaxID=6565 RepID=A0A8B8AKG0_CRAVI|nr:uncharacterized protein LOC111102568 [Crassostrea virginica]
MLLSSADKMAQTSINALANHHQTLQSYIHNMHKLANNVENEDLRKRKAFIFYENCSAYYLGELLEFLSPGLLKYSETIICKQSEQFLGRVSQNIKLRETKTIEVIRVLSCEEQIGALVYSSKSGAFWLSPVEAKLYYNTKISEEGKCLVIDGIKVKELNSPSKVRCIVVDNDTVVYMKDCHKLFTQEESQKNLLIDFAPMVVVCLSLTKDGELLVILQHPSEKHSGIARFNLKGECKQYLTHVVKKRTAEPILPGKNDVLAYIAENINGDICLSVDSENRKAAEAAVIIMLPNGVHRVTYQGQQSSEAQYVKSWNSLGFSLFRSFQPRGICTNVNGHILVADKSIRVIHVLDENGGFLQMLTIPDEPRLFRMFYAMH